VARQHADVSAAVAQRRQTKLEYVEAEIKVGAELFFPNAGFQIAVGCRNDPDVGSSETVSPQCVAGSILQEAQKLGLSGQGEGVNLIQD
jgi:hypothetical protein